MVLIYYLAITVDVYCLNYYISIVLPVTLQSTNYCVILQHDNLICSLIYVAKLFHELRVMFKPYVSLTCLDIYKYIQAIFLNGISVLPNLFLVDVLLVLTQTSYYVLISFHMYKTFERPIAVCVSLNIKMINVVSETRKYNYLVSLVVEITTTRESLSYVWPC